MKQILMIVATIFLFASTVFAVVPTTNQTWQLNNQMGAVANQVQLGTLLTDTQSTDGIMHRKLARITYDAAVGSDGSSAASNSDDGCTSTVTVGCGHKLGVTLPANAIIFNTWLDVVTGFRKVDGGNPTLGFTCESNNDLFAAKVVSQYSTANSPHAGLQYGYSLLSSTKQITAACEVRGSVAVSDIVSGKAILFIEYVVSE